ncbi:hypothetical protein SEA_SPARCETUS_6 [Microbacterium phage Sparcetus]|nr:hypothetical protein SEA_SPARCETUS_6 [Microbacterium phage Sparcetus]
MSGRAFVILMDEREALVKKHDDAVLEVKQAERTLSFTKDELEGIKTNLQEIEDAMRQIDPASMAILEGKTEPEGEA